MAGSRQRLILGLLAGALAVATAVVLVNRLVLRAEWWQVRHRTTPVPAAPLADVGPPPGSLTAAWQRATPVHRSRMSAYDHVAQEIVHGQLVVVSGRGVEVYDARTGAERWSYRRTGWVVLGWAVTRDHLVAYLERDGQRDDKLVVGFDAVSGELLWRMPEMPAATARSNLRWPAGAGVVFTTEDDRRSIFGRSAATGSKVWTARMPPGCRLPESAAYGSDGSDGTDALSVVALECVRQQRGRTGPNPERAVTEHRVLALDPATGRARWTKSLGTSGPPKVAVRGGVAAISDGSALRAYDREGKELAARSAEDVCGDGMCPVAVSGGRLVLVYQGVIEAVDMNSGHTAWRRDSPGYAALAAAGDRLYALRPKLAANLLPAGIDILDPAGGTGTTAPAPIALEQGIDGALPWLESAGGLLYAAVPEASPQPTGGSRVVALRGAALGRGPVELGGVPAKDWPDACTLLDRDDLAAARLNRYKTRPEHAKIGGVSLPNPVSCTYEEEPREEGVDPPKRESPSPVPTVPEGDELLPETGRGDPEAGADEGRDGRGVRGLTVTLKWVAESGPAASGLLAALRATQSQVRQRTDIGGDEAYELGPTAGAIALRVDRYVITINASSPPGAAPRLARAAAAHLDAAAPP